ncbi:MAG: UDP-N-acetylglucosamine--N-acetylmuramyl-(pentapeptide) pyrophosphoryl-undecaprenol N-acetylglucosamine transferase [Patescibacteria group bacterium]
MRILFTGGGTGGHIFPIVAVARELRNLYPKDDLVLYYIGPKDQSNLIQLQQEGFKIHHIVSGKIRNYFSWENITDFLFKIPAGIFQSFFLLLTIGPRLVFSKGGTGSLPVTFSAVILGIPVFLHESDIVPGRSNRVTSNWAIKVLISFEKTEYFNLAKTVLVGNPIKKELLEGSAESAKEIFNINSPKPVLLFLGGSQGAQSINEFILSILNDLLLKYEVIHVAGKNNYESVKALLPATINEGLEGYYHLYPHLGEIELKHAYKISSLIISRAGSASIFEIAAAGKPSILIPLPSAAQDHQSKNAYEYAKTGAAVIIEQGNLIPNFFAGRIESLISSDNNLEKMSQAALSFAKPLAAKAIAREILEYLDE